MHGLPQKAEVGGRSQKRVINLTARAEGSLAPGWEGKGAGTAGQGPGETGRTQVGCFYAKGMREP